MTTMTTPAHAHTLFGYNITIKSDEKERASTTLSTVCNRKIMISKCGRFFLAHFHRPNNANRYAYYIHIRTRARERGWGLEKDVFISIKIYPLFVNIRNTYIIRFAKATTKQNGTT